MARRIKIPAPVFPLPAISAIVVVAALSVHLMTAPAVVAQAVESSLIRPSTSLDAAIVQVARFYRQSIGFEQISSDPAFGGANPIDLTTLSVDQALAAVVERAGRAYRVQREGRVVFVRPAAAIDDAESWLNQSPQARGLTSHREEQQRASRPLDAPYVGDGVFRTAVSVLTIEAVLPDLTGLTLGEAWLEIQRPNRSWNAFKSVLQPEESLGRQFDAVRRRVTIAPAADVWHTVAELMTAHGGVAAWTLSHPGVHAGRGQTAIEIDGAEGWSLALAGIPPVTDFSSILDPTGELAAKSFSRSISALPFQSQPPAPLPLR